jgi:pyruvate dehydrogenase E1 component
MFGMQRTGDLVWQAADARTRGFLLGATAGRTTLLGEGLQHQDGHSHLLASAIPACRAYDPSFAYEVAAIVKHGIDHMYGATPEDVFYYLTLYNENMVMPARPTHVTDADIVGGLYEWRASVSGNPHASIVFSGRAFGAAEQAATILRDTYGIDVNLLSATSFKALRDDAMEVERWNRLHPLDAPRTSRVQQVFSAGNAPIVAVTDFMRVIADQVSPYLTGRTYLALGTDGMGRSDTRESLRRFFETDAPHVVVAVLTTLVGSHGITRDTVAKAIADFGIDPELPHGLTKD